MNTERLLKLLALLPYLLLQQLLLVLSFILYLLSWLLAPVLLLSRVISSILLLPIRMLAKFENVLIFFGVAVCVGAILGLALQFVERFGSQLFGLDLPDAVGAKTEAEGESPPVNEQPTIGHTAASYRAFREQKKKRLDEEVEQSTQSHLLVAEPVLRAVAERAVGESLVRVGRDMQASFTSPISPRQRAGLLSTTILEEEDDSEEKTMIA